MWNENGECSGGDFLQLGYNTNGFAHHRLEDVFDILASIGYHAIAVTLEHDLLDSFDRTGVSSAISQLRKLGDRFGLVMTLETGARFLLDPRRKHQPTLMSEGASDRKRRREFLFAAIDIAQGVNATCVSLWSGRADKNTRAEVLRNRLEKELRILLEYAQMRDVRLAFEPEPGMFVETMAQFARLERALDHPLFGLTLDVGHIHCLGDGEAESHIARWHEKLFNVHIEDMNQGVHEHRMFGEGSVSFEPVFDALRACSYAGPVNVELSRHSHDAVVAAKRSLEFLRSYVA